MKHFLLWLCAIAAVGIVTVFLASAQEASPVLKGLSGDWAIQITGNQFMAGTVHLSKVGNTVVGNSEAPEHKGIVQLNCKLSGMTCSGGWRGPTGATGWITLNFTASAKAFNGEWGYGGRKPQGSIVARKIQSTAF